MKVHMVGGGDNSHENYEILKVFLDREKALAWLHAYAQVHKLERSHDHVDYYRKGLAYACLTSYPIEDDEAV